MLIGGCDEGNNGGRGYHWGLALFALMTRAPLSPHTTPYRNFQDHLFLGASMRG